VASGLEQLPLRVGTEETCDCESSLFGSSESTRPLELDRLVELLTTLTGREAWDQRGASIEAHGCRVFATQSADTLQRVGHVLEQLRLAMAPRLEFEVVVFEEPKPARGFEVIERKQAVQIIHKLQSENPGAILYRGSTEGRPYSIHHVGERTRRSYVVDYDVEVAEKAGIADPRPESIDFDRGLTIYPVLQPDGVSVALFCLLTWRDAPREIGKLGIEAKGSEELDKLDVTETQVGFSVPLPPNGAFVYSPGTRTHPRLRVLVISSRLDPMPASSTWTVIPHSLLTNGAMKNPIVGEHEGDGWRGLPPPVDSDWLIGRLRNLDPEVWETDGAFLESMSEHLVVRADKESLRRLRQALAYLGRNSTKGYVVSVRREIRLADAKGAAWQSSGPALSVPVVAGRSCFLTTGRGQTYVADYESEVANDSALANPIIRAVLDGTELIAAVVPSGEHCLVQFDLAESQLAKLRKRPISNQLNGPIWSPEVDLARFSRSLLMRPGHQHVLGDGPAEIRADGKRYRTRFVLEVDES